MRHVGIDIANEKTVQKSHNRGCKILKLPWFSPQNLSKSEAEQRRQMSLQGGALIEGKECKDLKNVADGMLSLHSWMELMKHLHPMDFGPSALFRLMLEKYVSGQIKTVGQILRMFITVQSDNASRLIISSSF